MKRKALRVDVVTLFPAMFAGPFSESLIGRARKAGRIDIRVHDLRTWSVDTRHRKVDDRPYGGGAGMVLQPEPLYRALKSLGGTKRGRGKPWVVFLSPQGRVFNQAKAEELSKRKNLIFVCGRYEGIDERVMEWVDEEISIGDYVLTGGELPAMVVVDAVARFAPGVVGDPESVRNDSFSDGLLDFPHYTRPSEWRRRKVPEALLSGDHDRIARWRRETALKRTTEKRPDLIQAREKRTSRGPVRRRKPI